MGVPAYIPEHGVVPVRSPQERLDSWKEIAGYLNRDVRTAQRWEEKAGLPVRRLASGRRRPVYAYRAELDAWLLTQPLDASAANPDDSSALRQSRVSVHWTVPPLIFLLAVLAWALVRAFA